MAADGSPATSSSSRADPAPIAPPAIGAPAPADGERRHLTVLFCDLVGSTEIAARLDPEEWRDIAAEYQRTVADVVTRHGGHVAKYLGDGLVVYFGYPQAHEDDAERAVRAGLAIVDALAPLNDRLARDGVAVKLSVRVGIHAGSVAIGQGGGREADMFGDTPNIASRVQAAAAPDSVVITAAVHQLVAGMFRVEDYGARQLKGIERPVQLYRAIRPTVARRRRHPYAVRGLTPFVGREDEMRLLLSRWERVRDGEGHLVLVMGEAGIGKSRLLEEFRAQIKSDLHLWVECAGEPFFETTPFHVVVQMLNQGLGWRGDESGDDRILQLERSLDLAGLKLGEALPLIAEMLNLPVPEKYPPLMFSPDQKRKRLLAALAGWVFGATRTQPVVIVMEDLHWVDPSTLELVQTLVEQGATAPLMLLLTARPEFRTPWAMRAHHAQITLNRLNDRQTREMVACVAARAALAKDVIDTVIKRTGGVPLFAEELTRLVLEADGRSVAREIPVTLQDSLMARLDRLGPAKEVAQIAAVIGREFSYELLSAVAPMPEAELQAALDKLADAELIYTRGIPPEATYQFKHALIQDAAYNALLKSRRRDLHRHVARITAENFPAIAEAQPELIARHWTEAGEAEPAIAAWKKAVEAADARGALREAEEGCRQALAMLRTLPQSAERDARELELSSALAQLLLKTRGYTAPESLEAAAHARALAEKCGNLAQLVLRNYGTFAAVFATGDLPSAQALADQTLDVAEREGTARSLGIAHRAQLTVRFFRGDLLGAEEHFARLNDLIATADFKGVPGTLAFTIGLAALSAWALGRAERARERIAQAIAFARDNKNPYDLAFARFMEGWLHWWLREPERAEAAAAQAVAISDEHGFPYPRDLARAIMGWARARCGSAGEGVALIRQGLDGLIERRARVSITDVLARMAEAQALDGGTSDALGTIEDALAANPEELFTRPEILIGRGDLQFRLGRTEPAAADFREAIALAHKMGAKAWELRAATSLARVLRDGNRRGDARAALAPIYSSFSEGFDTADLADAESLLAELD